MAAVMVFGLAAAACLLYSVRRRHWPGPVGKAKTRRPYNPFGRTMLPWVQRPRRGLDVSMPRLVRQLSALLASGRNGPALWAALADVLATEEAAAGRRLHANSSGPPGARLPRGNALSGIQVPGPSLSESMGQSDANPAITLMRAVERASALGLPTAAAVRSAVRSGRGTPISPGPRGVTAVLSAGGATVWLEVAACFEVCEASGAPVASVLSRLAARVETEQDTADLRETALAGPRATVRLLTWLPFIGLGLGMAMGVDPISVLLGSPLGWACLAAGLALVLAGRWWSHGLISAAARSPSQPEKWAGLSAGSTFFRRAAAGPARADAVSGSKGKR